MKKLYILFIVALLCAMNASFGQKLSSSYIPTLLGDSVNTAEYDDLNPIYSSETSTLYFTRRNHPKNAFGEKKSEDIWFAVLQKDSSWSTPERLPEKVNNSQYNNVLSILDKGQSLLISGRYTKKGVWYKRGLSIVSKAGDTEWTSPRNIKIPGFQHVNDGRVMHAFMNNKQTALFFSFDKQHRGQKNNLFVSVKKKNEKWSRPKTLKRIDKASATEICPWLSNNGDTLFYATNRDGHFDMYQAARDTTGDKYLDWSEPTPLLLEGINSDKNESFSSLNSLNDIAFFASDREGTWDIYKVRRFERNPYILVTGTIFNQYKNAAIEQKYNSKLILKELVDNDGQVDTIAFVSESLVFDSITSQYAFRAPFNKEIILWAEAENFLHHTETISTQGKYEYGELTQNVNLDPLLYADIKGIIIDSITKAVLTINLTTLQPQIIVSDLSYEEAVIDSASNFTGIRLALGEKYAISAKVDGYDAILDTLDLIGLESYKDTTITLKIKKQPDPFMYISGVFKSTKDSSEITGDTKMYLNNTLQKRELVNGSNFTLKVPLNDTNSFHVHMHEYLDFEDTLYFKGEDHLDTNLTVYLTPIEEGMHMVIDQIYFEQAKAVLKENSYPALDLLVNFMEEYPSISIEISGHTDNVGSEKYNLKLSDKRAKTVGDYLIKKGINKERIITKGEGLSNPIVANDTEENRAKNRRVEFLILKK
jgi:outer membrane protein OmpA-like peptidoglycan-associated protein